LGAVRGLGGEAEVSRREVEWNAALDIAG